MATHVLPQGAGSRPPSPAFSSSTWQDLGGDQGVPAAGPGLEWGPPTVHSAAAVLRLAAGEGGLSQALRDRLRGGAFARTVGGAARGAARVGGPVNPP
jgi:hypothetical protein